MDRVMIRAQQGHEILRKANTVYDLYADDFAALLETGKYEQLTMAYEAGFYAGILYQRNENRKARKVAANRAGCNH